MNMPVERSALTATKDSLAILKNVGVTISLRHFLPHMGEVADIAQISNTSLTGKDIEAIEKLIPDFNIKVLEKIGSSLGEKISESKKTQIEFNIIKSIVEQVLDKMASAAQQPDEVVIIVAFRKFALGKINRFNSPQTGMPFIY